MEIETWKLETFSKHFQQRCRAGSWNNDFWRCLSKRPCLSKFCSLNTCLQYLELWFYFVLVVKEKEGRIYIIDDGKNKESNNYRGALVAREPFCTESQRDKFKQKIANDYNSRVVQFIYLVLKNRSKTTFHIFHMFVYKPRSKHAW